MENLFDIFRILSKYETHESVYFTGPSPDQLTSEDLQAVLDRGAEWLEDQKMWKRQITLSDVVVSRLEDQSDFLRSSFVDIKLKI